MASRRPDECELVGARGPGKSGLSEPLGSSKGLRRTQSSTSAQPPPRPASISRVASGITRGGTRPVARDGP